MDSSIVKQIWSGQVPVHICYNNTTLPLMLYRQNYLHCYSHIIMQYHDVDSRDTDVVYTVQYIGSTVELPHNLSIGTIYDVYHTDNTVHSTVYTQPVFTISAQFVTAHKSQQLQLRSILLNNIKQSLLLQYRYCKFNVVLSSAEINELYQSIAECNMLTYTELVSKLLISHTHNTKHSTHNLPVRFVLCNMQQTSTLQHTYLQPAIELYTDTDSNDRQLTTLYAALYKHYQFIFDSRQEYDDQYMLYSNIVVLIQGIEVPLNTPLNWLCQHMLSADQWLYVVVKRQSVE